MPEKLTEAQARQICIALRVDPDGYQLRLTAKMQPLSYGPNWQRVQRAAEEEKP